LPFFTLILWFGIFFIKFLPPTLPLFISQALDLKWRHHLHPPHMNRNRKQCAQGKGEVVFPSHFLLFCSYFSIKKIPSSHQQWYSSPQTESKTISSSSPHQQQ
jgi:hypothetical protein